MRASIAVWLGLGHRASQSGLRQKYHSEHDNAEQHRKQHGHHERKFEHGGAAAIRQQPAKGAKAICHWMRMTPVAEIGMSPFELPRSLASEPSTKVGVKVVEIWICV
jgi:hypothetical protein